MRTFVAALFDPWALRMAVRDLRRSRARLGAVAAAVTCGVAALVSISSFGHNLQDALDAEARGLLGADLQIASRRPFSPATEQLVSEILIGKERATVARRLSFTTMARFPETDGTRLVRVRAVEDGFPFDGVLDTEPEDAANTFRQGRRALVDDSVLHQFGAGLGDEIRLGRHTYRIEGRLLKIPGESAAQALLGPRVFIPYSEVDPDLLARGSRVDHDLFLDLPDDAAAARIAAEHAEHALDHDLDLRTVAEVRERWGRAGRDLESYLSLVAFVAVLLGGLGVGSSLQVHLAKRRTTVAILRCLGAPAPRAFAVFLWQALLVSAVGVVGGLVLGTALQGFLPRWLSDFVPVEVPTHVAPAALLEGSLVGFAAALWFALAPLLPLRRIPPRAIFRTPDSPASPDRARLALLCAGVSAVAGFAYWHAPDLGTAAIFVGGLAGGTLLLALTAAGLRRLARGGWMSRLPFELRQGLRNLDRPGNQTRTLVLTLGLGVFLLLTLHLSRDALLREFSDATGEGRANLVLFDIQDDQREDAAALVREHGHPVLDMVPIVTLRIREIDGVSTAELRGDEASDIPEWALLREYRCTYREQLDEESELLIAGEFIGRVDSADGVVPVSVEERIAERLGIGLGSHLSFDVEGIPIRTVVRSLREVEWRRARPNFFVVFPAGVLEEAPKFHVLLTRTGNPEQSALLQRTLVDRLPNVSAVDVRLVLDILDEVMGQLTFVVRFMAAFSVACGGIVLFTALWTNREHRLGEAAVLRTLGASESQVRRVLTIESLSLGAVAAVSGSLLSVVAAALLTVFLFRGTYVPTPSAPFVAIVTLCATTWAVGSWTAAGVGRRPPLQSLREED